MVYWPVAAVLGRMDRTGAPEWIAPVSPLFGFVFLALTFLAWRRGVRRYTSAGG